MSAQASWAGPNMPWCSVAVQLGQSLRDPDTILFRRAGNAQTLECCVSLFWPFVAKSFNTLLCFQLHTGRIPCKQAP